MKIRNQEQFDVIRRFLHRVWNMDEDFGNGIEDYLDKLENSLLEYKGVKVIE